MSAILDDMSFKYLSVVGAIVAFSIVQSLFGVGLLVFGTPTLLLLGYPFNEALSYLLPSSIAISAIQVIEGRRDITLFRRYVPVYILPFVAVGLISILCTGGVNLNVAVGIMMIMTVLIRLSRQDNNWIGALSKKYLKLGLMLTGLIHGATNLGGAPLLVITNNVYANKEPIRANVAYAYLLMAISQIIILCLMQKLVINIGVVVVPLISALTYIALGRGIYKTSSAPVYYHLMTMFMFVFGICLLVK